MFKSPNLWVQKKNRFLMLPKLRLPDFQHFSVMQPSTTRARQQSRKAVVMSVNPIAISEASQFLKKSIFESIETPKILHLHNSYDIMINII